MNRLAIHLNAGNDRNGNPRRLYLIVQLKKVNKNNWAEVIDAIDENYSGHGAVKQAGYDDTPVIGRFDTTPAEYRDLLKRYGKK